MVNVAAYESSMEAHKGSESESHIAITTIHGNIKGTTLSGTTMFGAARKMSVAQAFSRRVNTKSSILEPLGSDTSWGPMVGTRSVHDTDLLEDMYIEEIITTGEKAYKQKKQQNIRATMGFYNLLWFDFKNWYARKMKKSPESPLFRNYIRQMESHFGSGVGAFFVFTRWIICLNAFLTFGWLCLVVLPAAVLFDYSHFNTTFSFRNLLDGQGVMAQSWVFYGSYRTQLASYHLALAYLSMALVTYFGSLFIILGSIACSIQPTSASSGAPRFKFCLLLWTSWDHSICSDEAACNLTLGISSTFKDNLHEAKATVEDKKRTKRDKYKVYSLRLLAWLLTIILIGGGCAAIIFLVIFVNFSEVQSTDSEQAEETEGGMNNFFSVYGTTIIFSLINIFIPLCISKLPIIEHYVSGKTELNITLSRVFFLRMANLIALITSLYSKVNGSHIGCTGTLIGQEMYKLVVMDTIVHVCVQMSMSFGKYFWKREKAEFNISSAVLVIIYRQALIWVGTIACPVLPLVGLLSNLVFFLMNYGIVQHTCKPPTKRWNQSRNSIFFKSFLLAALCIILVPISVAIGSRDIIHLGKTQRNDTFCGPFQDTPPTSAFGDFRRDQADWLKDALTWIVSDTVVLPLFLIMVAILRYLHLRINQDSMRIVALQAELQQEREDNKKLVKKVQILET